MMTTSDRVIFLLVISLVTLLSIASATPRRGAKVTAVSGGEKDRSRPKRASLHELLQNRGKVASPPVLDAESAPLASADVPPNENRRVLVLGDADDEPNYVYDDEDYNSDDTKDGSSADVREGLDADLYDSDMLGKDDELADVGDSVTDYASHFAAADAPSYADPDLLAAVMNQADEANFQYPIHGGRKIIAVQNQNMAGSAKVETVSDAQKNDINPFELFPPSFHELLEIPIHTYANGTTYNPHDRHKARPRRPIITRGYANTKVNGQSATSKEDKDRKNDFDSKRIQTRRKPSFNLRTNEKKYSDSVSATTEKPTTTSFPTERRNLYSIKKDEGQRLPPPRNNVRRRRPLRPSLRFRTRVPTETTTTATTTAPEPTTTITTTTTESPMTTTKAPQTPTTTSWVAVAVTPIHTTRRSYQPVTRRFSPTRKPIDQNVQVKRRKKPVYQNIRESDHQNDDVQGIVRQNPTLIEPRPKPKESFDPRTDDGSERIVERPINNFRLSDNLKENTENVFEEKLKVYEVPPQKYSSFEEKSNPDIIKYDIPTAPSEIYKIGYKETSLQNKKPIKSPFKPSKSDPFVGRFPSYKPLSKSRPNKVQHIITTTTTQKPYQKPYIHSFNQVVPTTYRPPYSSSVLPPVLNTYERPVDVRSSVYDDFEHGILFTNSHTLRRPLTSYNHPQVTPTRQQYYPAKDERVPVNQRDFDQRPISVSHSEYVQHPISVSQRDYVQNSNPVNDRGYALSHNTANQENYVQSPISSNDGGYVQKVNPVYVSSPFFGGAHTINEQYNRYDQHDRNSNLSPSSNIYNRESYANNRLPPRRRTHRPIEDRRHPIVKRLPSFLQKFNLFRPKQVNRRSGLSGPNSDVNDIKTKNDKDSKNSKIDYVLAHNPLPIDGKKVVVVGPFKDPPIGAPLIYPNSDGYRVSNLKETVSPSFDLLPPSSVNQPRANSATPQRQPSFKVINLSKESKILVEPKKSEAFGDVVESSQELTKNVINSRTFQTSSKSVPKTYHKPITTDDGIMSSLQVKHNNYHLFKEVSDADKERLIAAKFEFPREPSVRRHGLEKHVIPIPVPLISSSGKQISKFRNLHVSHIPINRKLNNSPVSKNEIVYTVNQNSLPTNTAQKTLSSLPPVPYYQPSLRGSLLPPRPTEAPAEFVGHEQPQSYREPTFDDVSFGGWQGVNENLSSVKENANYNEERKENVNYSDNSAKKEVKTKDKATSLKKEQKLDEKSKLLPSELPEKQFVRFSSELNVEAPEVVRSFLVEPPKKL